MSLGRYYNMCPVDHFPAAGAFHDEIVATDLGALGRLLIFPDAIAKFMARFGMDVIDFGTPLFNMHAPWELASRHDCLHTKKAYAAYFNASERK